MDLIEPEGIFKRWEEYRELCKKDVNDLNSPDGVVTHPEPEHPGM